MRVAVNGSPRMRARQTQSMAQTAKARLAVAEGSLDELLSWQRQTDELLQTAVRARDDSLVTDLAAMLEAAQIQARLSGDVIASSISYSIWLSIDCNT